MDNPESSNIRDKDPIPEGTYSIALEKGVPPDKTGGGWGKFGIFLNPRFGTKLWNFITNGRNGFFLHKDGNEETNPGTAGCIGVEKKGGKINKVIKTFKGYQKKGNDEIEVIVDYDYIQRKKEEKSKKKEKEQNDLVSGYQGSSRIVIPNSR